LSETPDAPNSTELRDFWKLQFQNKRLDHNKCSLCCAPEDVTHPEDVLDDDAEILLERLK
jgi:GTP 3',8-cyclase